MNCEKVIARLSEYYDRELDEALTKEFERHLANCKDCASELNDFAAIGGMLKSTDTATIAACDSAPKWEKLASRLEASDKTLPATSVINSRLKLAIVGAVALAASIFLIVSLNMRTNPGLSAHSHEHTATGSADIAIDFEKLLDGESIQPMAALNSLSRTFDGREADLEESETQLGYKPSISQALPSGVKLVSNRILKLPQCNCPTGECSCGPAGCNCSASLCERVDGTEFLVVEHCATQNISFGELKSEVIRDNTSEMQLLTTGKQFMATWITPPQWKRASIENFWRTPQRGATA